MLDNLGYRHTHTHTHWMCNICYFSTATMVTRMLLSIILYACCLSPHPHMAYQSTMYLSLDFLFGSPPSPFLLLFSFIFFSFLISLPFLHVFSSPFPVCDFTLQCCFPHSDIGSPPTSTHSSSGLGQPLLPLFALPPPFWVCFHISLNLYPVAPIPLCSPWPHRARQHSVFFISLFPLLFFFLFTLSHLLFLSFLPCFSFSFMSSLLTPGWSFMFQGYFPTEYPLP